MLLFLLDHLEIPSTNAMTLEWENVSDEINIGMQTLIHDIYEV